MSRIPFSQMLKEAGTDIRREYDRLYDLFWKKNIYDGMNCIITLRSICDEFFTRMPFSGTCVSLNDFDVSYKCVFREFPRDFDLDYLIRFCEYSYNLVYHVNLVSQGNQTKAMQDAIQFYLRQIQRVVEKIGYMGNVKDCITDFVPKDPAAISMAEIVDPELSYRVIEYNHHSMKGDLERKRATLLVLADKLEAQRSKLKQINTSLETDIFFLFNSVNVRHNNTDPNGKKHIPFVAGMKNEEIEYWYDELYQMCLLAFLELDHLGRKNSLNQLKNSIQTK